MGTLRGAPVRMVARRGRGLCVLCGVCALAALLVAGGVAGAHTGEEEPAAQGENEAEQHEEENTVVEPLAYALLEEADALRWGDDGEEKSEAAVWLPKYVEAAETALREWQEVLDIEAEMKQFEAQGATEVDINGTVLSMNEAKERLTERKRVVREACGVALTDVGEIYLMAQGGLPSNFTAAREYLERASDMGCADAQNYLGFMYSLGLGVPRSTARAVLYYYFAAAGGSMNARLSLGYRHLHGLGVPRSCSTSAKYYLQVAEEVVADLTEDGTAGNFIERLRLSDEENRRRSADEEEDVIQYYQHSAEAGDVGAQVALGQLHLFGARGVPQDYSRAAQFFRAAASQGEPSSMASLGELYAQGMGVPRDNETALELFRNAAAMGNAAGKNGLGYMYMHGSGVKQDYEEAVRHFKQAAEQGNADAQFNLGVLYLSGLGVMKNYATAVAYFTLAAHQGHTRALFNLGQMHLNGLGTVANCDAAVKFLKTVAERGPWALILSQAHRQFVAGRLQTSFLLYAIGAEQGFEVAQSNSGWLLNEGLGYDKPDRLDLAFRHFSMAAQQGNADAYRIVGDYYYDGTVPRSAPRSLSRKRSSSPSGAALSSTEAGGAPPDSTEPISAADAIVAAQKEREEARRRRREERRQQKGDQQQQPAQGTGDESAKQQAHELVRRKSAGGEEEAKPQPDYEMAAHYYQLASEKECAEAKFNLGFMHEHGIGLPRDLHLAKRYYDEAAGTSADAVLPVRLALIKLWFHGLYDRFMEWYANPATKATKTTTPSRAAAPPATASPPVPARESDSSSSEGGDSDSDSGASPSAQRKPEGKWKHRRSPRHFRWLYELLYGSSMAWDDILLAFLFASLIAAVFLRIRRREPI